MYFVLAMLPDIIKEVLTMGNENVMDIKDAIYQKMESFGKEANDRSNKKYENVTPFYTMVECSDLPKPVTSQTLLTLKDLCSIITKTMRTLWHDYYKTTFYMTPGGFLQVLMIFADNPNPIPTDKRGNNTKIKNVKTIYQGEQDLISTMMENSNRKQRRTIELTELGKMALEQYMIRNNRNEIKWNECLEEREFNTTDLIRYPSGKFNGLVVKNVQVTSLLDSIWTPMSIQQADYDRAFEIATSKWKKTKKEKLVEVDSDGIEHEKEVDKIYIEYPEGWNKARVLRTMTIEKSYTTQLIFKGYRINDQMNNPVGFDPTPKVSPNMILDFENYYVAVAVTDMQVYKSLINPNFIQSGGMVNCF